MFAYPVAEASFHPLAELVGGMTPSGVERLKLDRLRELRAVIDSLRVERDVRLTLRDISFADRLLRRD